MTTLSPRRTVHLLILFIFWLSSLTCALVTSEHADWIPFGEKYLEEPPQPITPKVKSVPKAKLKLTWNKALQNGCRVNVTPSAFPSRSAAVELSVLLMQTLLPYSSQLVFNFLSNCLGREVRSAIHLVPYFDNFNLKSNFKSRQCFGYFFFFLFFLLLLPVLLSPTSAPLWRHSSGDIAAAFSLPSRPLVIHGPQQERSSKQDEDCIWMRVMWGLILETSRDKDSSSCPSAWLALGQPSVLCILHRTAQAAKLWARITAEEAVVLSLVQSCLFNQENWCFTDRHP